MIGGGIQGTSVAYHLAERGSKVTILEAVAPASAASGKGGGFMARSWGDGSPTQKLHELGFDLYAQLATQLQCTTYRTLPVLSVTPGYTGIEKARKSLPPRIVPNWLDGNNIGRVSVLGYGEDTAQITPSEFVEKMIHAHPERIQIVHGTCVGLETDPSSSRGVRKVTGVRYTTINQENIEEDEPHDFILPADAVVISAGPWSCAAEDWLARDAGVSISLPMEGVKSTSIVWKPPPSSSAAVDGGTTSTTLVDATALFCGEDSRFGTHLEVYPRPNGEIYICGIGGSDYVPTEELKRGAFLTDCNANESRVDAAVRAFQDMSSTYRTSGELEKTQACMRPCPPDAMPYMGTIPGCEGIYMNAGHNCWGIAWSPACGKAMAELILDGTCRCVDLQPFDPARFTQKTSNRGRKKQGVDVGEQW